MSNSKKSYRKTVVVVALTWLLRNPTATAAAPLPKKVAAAFAKATEVESEIMAEVLQKAEAHSGCSNLDLWFLPVALERAAARWGR